MAQYSDNKVRIAIDFALMASIIFGGGAAWQKIAGLEAQMAVVTSAGERLARVETKIDAIGRQLDRLERITDGDKR